MTPRELLASVAAAFVLLACLWAICTGDAGGFATLNAWGSK